MTNQWKLIEDLEKDNTALTNAARNAATSLEQQRGYYQREIRNLKLRLKKIESDNKFLKQMVLRGSHLNNCELGQLLRQLFSEKK